MKNSFHYPLPDESGYFGPYGGSFVPEELQKIIDEITQAYITIRDDPDFRSQLADLYKHYVGRPSPIFHAKPPRLIWLFGNEFKPKP